MCLTAVFPPLHRHKAGDFHTCRDEVRQVCMLEKHSREGGQKGEKRRIDTVQFNTPHTEYSPGGLFPLPLNKGVF